MSRLRLSSLKGRELDDLYGLDRRTSPCGRSELSKLAWITANHHSPVHTKARAGGVEGGLYGRVRAQRAPEQRMDNVRLGHDITNHMRKHCLGAYAVGEMWAHTFETIISSG